MRAAVLGNRIQSRPRKRWSVAGALCAFLAIGASVSPPARADSQSFTTPGQSSFVVPAGVHSIYVVAAGARGGTGANFGTGNPGGLGDQVSGMLAVTPGETLYVNVGGAGMDGSTTSSSNGGAAGINGGGTGGGGAAGGGGGGGASDIRTRAADPSTRLVVAAGGGGGGSSNAPSGARGGNAGQAGGSLGGSNGTGGGPGTTTSGGAAGTNGTPACGTTAATAGAFGSGGNGAPASFCGGGGGGGGGYFGGGGGGNSGFSSYAGGGGGGADLTSSLSGAASVLATYTGSGDGSVSITWNVSQPATVAVVANPGSVFADGHSPSTITATVRDAAGNPLVGEPVTISSSDPGQRVGSVADNGNGTYTAIVTSSTTIGVATITATDARTGVSGSAPLSSYGLTQGNPNVALTVPGGVVNLPLHRRTLAIPLVNGNPFAVYGNAHIGIPALGLASRAGGHVLLAATGVSVPANSTRTLYLSLSQHTLNLIKVKRHFGITITLRLADAPGHPATVVGHYLLAGPPHHRHRATARNAWAAAASSGG